jgi:hypothetical protein
MRKFALIPALLAAGIALDSTSPSVGDECLTWHAKTQAPNGRTLTCVRSPYQEHLMLWEYGGFSDGQD